jgi:putative flippase GtrA
MKNINKIFNNKKIIKYLIMAIIIVAIELILFQALYLSTDNYYLATIFSFVLGLILNWIGGRLFIFGKSERRPTQEFIMVSIASLAGISIQIATVAVTVNIIGLYPISGKIVSIMFSFFWNYWFRSKYIYNNK